jgi:hypothetical protein
MRYEDAGMWLVGSYSSFLVRFGCSKQGSGVLGNAYIHMRWDLQGREFFRGSMVLDGRHSG